MRAALLPTSLLLGLTLAALRLGAVEPPAAPSSIQSHTGQFIITSGTVRSVSPSFAGPVLPTGIVRLEPNLTAVSAERVKSAIWHRLGVTGSWRGKIRLHLVAGLKPDQDIRLASTLYGDGWQYRIELPRDVVVENFVRAVTQVVLLELGNRHSSGRCAEIPLWFSEGFTQYLLATEPDLTVRAETKPTFRSERRADPFQRARASLGQISPLTFNELSWPSAEDLTGARREFYKKSAHFFFTAVVRRPDGPAALRKFLGALSKDLNWQTGFLRAFHPRFERLIDVEKWWAVTLASFSGRNESQVWPAETALTKIDEVLLTEAHLNVLPNALPQRTTLSLATIVQDWNLERQEPVLSEMINTLAALRLNVPGELVQLLDDYRGCLDEYLKRRKALGFAPAKGQASARPAAIVEETVRRLASLDQRREMWRREYAAASVAPSGKGSRSPVGANR